MQNRVGGDFLNYFISKEVK